MAGVPGPTLGRPPPGKPPVPPKPHPPLHCWLHRSPAVPPGSRGAPYNSSHGAAARRPSGGVAVHLGLTEGLQAQGGRVCVNGLVYKGLGSKRRRTWERSTHRTRVPQDLHKRGVRKWMERAAGGRTSARLVADRRQVDPRPPGSRHGPTLSRWSSHKGLSRSVVEGE